jgi:hypothetical protein
MKKERCAHEYKRNGTTTLFAALDILKRAFDTALDKFRLLSQGVHNI